MHPTQQEIESSRPQARMHELMKSIVTSAATTDPTGTVKNIKLKFLLRPIQVTCQTAPLPQLPLQTRALDSALDVKNIDNSTVGAKVYSLHREKTVTGIDLHKTELHGDAHKQVAKDTTYANGNVVHVPCQLLLKSVGYRSVKLLGVPFDHKRSIVPNSHGRVTGINAEEEKGAYQHAAESAAGKDGGIHEITAMLNKMLQSDETDSGSVTPASGNASAPAPANANNNAINNAINNVNANANVAPLYVVGWLKNGPKGTIATSVTDAKDTVSSILADLTPDSSNAAALIHQVTSDPISSIPVLKSKSIVNWAEWQLIEKREEAAGQENSPAKPMIKVSNSLDMMLIAKGKK